MFAEADRPRESKSRRGEIERLREQKRRWMELADQRAIEVGTLKTEITRLQTPHGWAARHPSHWYSEPRHLP
jgi:hypothetical protein